MKTRVLFAALALAAASLTACSSETVSHDATTLPENARNLISKNFSAAISLVETEKSMGTTHEYEVTLADGSEITFGGNGEWKSVETPSNRAVPSGLVPTAIAKYVAERHAGASVIGIEKNKKGYEVELSNGLEMQFDAAGNFLQYDK